MKYYELVEQFKGKVDFKFMVVINNETLKKRYHILSNLYCDPPRIAHEWLSTGNYTAKQYRVEISILKKLLNKKLKLVATENDMYYTRLVYKLI